MPVDRFYCAQNLRKDDSIALADQEYHHLAHVTRAKVGDRIEVVNGQGQLAAAEIESLSKKSGSLRILSVEEFPKPREKIILVQAIPRMNRLDFIIEKGTELGMSELWLFPGEKGERVKLTEQQVERLLLVAISAMKQCGRLYLPPIIVCPPLLKWKTIPIGSFYGDLKPDAPSFLAALSKVGLESAIHCFIGPESGFSEQEIACLMSGGAMGVSLHHNILRTDTAALAALAVAYSQRSLLH